MIVAKAVRLTSGARHHFFGFHDLEITSRASGLFVGLAVDNIDQPPLGTNKADLIVWDESACRATFEPKILASTLNYNFPQGARQHWLGDKDIVILNEVNTTGEPVAGLYDANIGSRIGQISTSSYCSNRAGTHSFTVDFGRLHRLGGYGHSNVLDRTPENPLPRNNGIFVTHIDSDRTDLLLSIRDIADQAGLNPNSSSHAYITHLKLSPREDRIAFLLRYRLSDGGDETCLCTLGVDGSAVRILSRGFMSHYDWIGDGTIMIWGRRSAALAALRRHSFLSNPLTRNILPLVKKPLRALLGRSNVMSTSFLQVPDSDAPEIATIGFNVFTEDGHPMTNPIYPRWLVTDTYPDAEGVRDLMLYDIANNVRHDLGRYAMLNAVPSEEVVALTARHLALKVNLNFSAEQYAFTRSGLHCDLHPRWTADGKTVAFDSIHEGTRQIYAIDVSGIVSADEVRG